MARPRSLYVAYIDENGTECCQQGHATLEEARLHAIERMREMAAEKVREGSR